MLAEYDGTKITLNEVHRFRNEHITVNGTVYWDVLRLFHEIKTGLVKGHQAGGYECIGIDTWGVDYGIIDENGFLIGNPVQYRDRRTDNIFEKSEKIISNDELYLLTGNQVMEINTAFQLLAEKEQKPYMFREGNKILMMPDLFAYMLTGNISAETSIASTTQLFDQNRLDWSDEAIEKFGLRRDMFPNIIKAGESKGYLRDELCRELNIPKAEVRAVCGHDTQCACFAVPDRSKRDFIFLSCGTWSLLGTELDAPVINEKSAKFNITNEVGYDGKITFLNNITGLWLIQETRNYLKSQGEDYSFAELEKMALDSSDFCSFADPDYPELAKHGDIPSVIREYCRKTGQKVPENTGEIMRSIYLGLALKYRQSIEEIETCTDKKYDVIYIVGGGVRDETLCQLTADICGIKAVSGSSEATAMGNAAILLMHCGAIKNAQEAGEVIGKSSEMKVYLPKNDFSALYDKFKINKKVSV